ncbi:MAG: NAD(P)H-hydrate dehydratase [Verrucomicrobia bacterium]|nr:NAD(P)H-hydrate dehydratase [Verrucomicrobiota bacterium]
MAAIYRAHQAEAIKILFLPDLRPHAADVSILTRAQMVEAEQAAFASGVEASELMESAGRQMAEFVRQNFPDPGTCRAFAGKGHNGGDVLVAARHLAAAGWRVEIMLSGPLLAPLTEAQLRRLDGIGSPQRSWPLVVLDGLLGIGAKGNPREPVATGIREINHLREDSGAWVLAADLPSGLDADTGEPGEPCVRADATMAMGFAKIGLLVDAAVNFVGRLAIAPLDGLAAPDSADKDAEVIRPSVLRSHLPPRVFDTHKGMAGRVAIVAGSAGFSGAARLCSAAAVAGGAGLVTLFVKEDVYPILATAAIPEVMVRQVDSYQAVLQDRWDAIAIGPGLSTRFAEEIVTVVKSAACPCVVDADALNGISKSPGVLSDCTGPRLLTPHPGEMERLSPCGGRTRMQWMTDFVREFPVTLLLKGARTIIGRADRPAAYNTTGNPGMASGGMGDVLTGISAALLAQGLDPYEAAMAGAWACGRAAEIAIASGGESQESLRASHVIKHAGRAFQSLRRGDF